MITMLPGQLSLPETPLRPCDLPPTGDWFDLYPKGRSKDPYYAPETMSHPAKMSLPLLRTIIAELLKYGILRTGGTLLDPFGGRGATGVEWCKICPVNKAITVELESHYIDMQFGNREQAASILNRPLNWQIHQGDSRKLHEWLPEALCAVSSPPYGKGVVGGCNAKAAERLRALTQDPKSSLYGRDPNGAWFEAMVKGYQPSPGNLDLLPVDADYGDLEARIIAEETAAVGSPPYEDSLCSDDPQKRGGLFRDPRRAADRSLTGNYNGNYAAVGSQPYEGSLHDDGHAGPEGAEGRREFARLNGISNAEHVSPIDYRRKAGYADLAAVGSQPFEAQSGGHPEIKEGPLADPKLHERHAASRIGKAGGYSEATDGQIGNKKGPSYADACRDVYKSMALAGVPWVILVTKNPVKDQKPRRLDLLTERLMNDAGYVLRAVRHAYLWQTVAELRERGVIVPRPEQPKGKMDEKYWDCWDEKPVGEISFFNCLHIIAGRVPPAQHEDVLFFEKVS